MAASSYFALPHEAFAKGFYRSDAFDYEVRCLLGHAVHGASDTGEVLATIASVGENDHEAWFAAWRDLGTRLVAQGDSAHAAGHTLSASRAYLRAATYLAVATNSAAGLRDAATLLPTFHAHRSAWNSFVDTTPFRTERVRIPYEDTTLPGYLFLHDGSPRPTLILVNGSDGSISSLWANGGSGAYARGYNVLLFDGPGQQTMLFDRGVPFRPDWEAVITPVVDYLLARQDVDAARIAIYGISQGGFWVARALAFEHRIAAGVADPGIVEVAASWERSIPKKLFQLVDEGRTEAFDKDMALGLKFSRESERNWNFRARPYGQRGYYATLEEVRRYDLTDVAAEITTPLLITSPEDEQFWPGQSDLLADLVPDHAYVARFTAAEGANLHCQPLARALTDQRALDWLDDQLARVGVVAG
jgi:hypothetical protein